MPIVLGTLVSFALSATTVAAGAYPVNIPSEAYIDVRTNGTIWPWRVFKSSDQTPPNLTITTNGAALADGYIFMTPYGYYTETEESGAFILTDENELVFGFEGETIYNFRVQTLKGRDYLTWWSGFAAYGRKVGHGFGQLNLLDEEYQPTTLNPDLHLTKLTKKVNPVWSIDLHEQQATDRGTMLVSAYNNTAYDLRPVNGSADGWLADGQFYELDVATGEVLFSWKATDHIPITASMAPLNSTAFTGTKVDPWDWFHINSIQAVGPNYLVNSRHCWAAYLISGADGSIIWTLQGETGGSFGALPEDGTFRWQHDARLYNVTETSVDIGLFDNHQGDGDYGPTPARGLVYHLELPAKKSYKPQMLRKIGIAGEALYVASQGSYDPTLSNGNQLMGYGEIAVIREYGPATDGSDLRWQATFGAPEYVQSYRAYKQTWRATPAGWDPKLVVEDGKAYVSWNGATEVKSWSVYVGASEETLSQVGVAKKKGFETVFAVPEGAKVIQVAARQGGKEVRKSNVVVVGG